jgi:anhydro-N-acetylmuramic acid kinase
MSGTSLDGVDGVLVEFSNDDSAKLLALASVELPDDLRNQLLALNTAEHNEIERSALASHDLANLYAQVVHQLLKISEKDSKDIVAIGVHGQTIRHQPNRPDGRGFTVQINQPALLAELCNIDVVADFRSRDVAAKGQGAPLVPGFHEFLWNRNDRSVAVLNLGGMSNLTLLQPNAPVIGFDCGPGNVLMDGWCQQHTGHRFDFNGQWAATGQVIPDLLEAMLMEDFFQLPPPKSTGRDRFNMSWLHQKLLNWPFARPEDVQASLQSLTVQTCANALLKNLPSVSELIVCGGGALNRSLMQNLAHVLPQVKVSPSDRYGLPAMSIEAAAFAWLASRTIDRKPGNLVSATGALGSRILGAIYPA